MSINKSDPTGDFLIAHHCSYSSLIAIMMLDKIKSREANIGVIGLGYIGLSLISFGRFLDLKTVIFQELPMMLLIRQTPVRD